MDATYIYKLAPHSAFHFGLRGVGVEESASFCPADTLFSALCLTLLEWETDGKQALESWLARFSPGESGLPPLRLSSAFPYAGEVCFFPRPMMPANMADETAPQGEAKTLKKIRLVSEGILRAWLEHKPLSGELNDEQLLHGGRVWVTSGERDELKAFLDKDDVIRMWTNRTRPRVSIDRMRSNSSVYQAGVVRFKPGAGLFTLVEFPDDPQGAERARLTTLLQVLGHGGLGGERSSGYGQFDLKGPKPFEGFGALRGERFLTLSPYHPTWPEVQAGVLKSGAAYKLQTRRGWVGATGALHLRRRSVCVLSEGSILHHRGQASYGDLADVSPRYEDGHPILNHKVWRYGIAFPLPVLAPLQEGD